MARRQARAAALQLIYENMSGGDGGDETLIDLIGFEPDEEDRQFISTLLDCVKLHRSELDSLIESTLTTWTLDRIARVNHAVLLLALSELKYMHTADADVVISEAVSLADRFETPSGARFVNGVLSAVNKKMSADLQP